MLFSLLSLVRSRPYIYQGRLNIVFIFLDESRQYEYSPFDTFLGHALVDRAGGDS
jgi:hypothetical protein